MTASPNGEAAKPWLVQQADDNVVHVLPAVGTDQIQHDLGETCPCGPTSERQDTPRGDGWVLVHHSLDGRELREDGRQVMAFIGRAESVRRSLAAVEGAEFEESVPLLFLAHARELAAEVRRLQARLDRHGDDGGDT